MKKIDLASLAWFLILITLLVGVLTSCKSELTAPEVINISGRYDNGDNIILLIDQHNNLVEGTLEFDGKGSKLSGTFDSKVIGDGQVMLDGIGGYLVHLNLIYDTSTKTLSGAINFGNGSQSIVLVFRNKLSKKIIHNQGGIQ